MILDLAFVPVLTSSHGWPAAAGWLAAVGGGRVAGRSAAARWLAAGWTRPARGSGVVAERGPGLRPGRPQAGGQVDRRTLLVVADAQAVLERGDPPDVSELAAQEPGSRLTAMAAVSAAGGGPQSQKLLAPL